MSSIQAYKAHKQEGTIAATTLVSKVHKQGASSNSQGVQHNNHRLAKNTKKELGTAHHNDASSTAICDLLWEKGPYPAFCQNRDNITTG